MHSRLRGFTLVEMLVLVAIVIAVAGVVVPVVSIYKLDDQWRRVDRDLGHITDALRQYALHTRTFPTGHSGATTYHFLYSDGVRPTNNVFDSGPSQHIDEFLLRGDMSGSDWRGPYLASVGPDPWGHAYLVNVNGYFSSVERMLILCAGPNGQVNTSPSATTAGGDDVIVVIE